MKQKAYPLQRFQKLLKRTSDHRGNLHEQIIIQTLEEMQSAGEILYFYAAPKFSKLDKKGIDVVINLHDGSERHLQIKSSDSGKRNHYKKYPDIPAIAPKLTDSYETLSQEIKNLLKIE